jgi:putative aldouronate transport system permease protein
MTDTKQRKEDQLPGVTRTGRVSRFFYRASRQKQLLAIGLGFLAYLIIFKYIPIWGWIMAFQDYKPYDGVFGSEWVGLKYFKELFNFPQFYRVIRNTLAMSILNQLTGTFMAIVFALLLNEARGKTFKRTVQTVSYLPHFVSWVVAANIVLNVLSINDGIVNRILLDLNIIDRPVMWIGKPEWFWVIIAGSNVWKNMGWNAILYLAAMTAIDPSLYEAAAMEGAGRIKRMWYVTIPGILPTIVVLFIINLGYIMNAGFEQQLLLGNPLVIKVSEVLDIFVIKYGISLGRYSFATAAGIFKSVVSVIMILSANWVAGKSKMERLF